MEHLPLFISASALLLWVLTALLWPGQVRLSTRAVGLGLSLVQLGASIWAAVRTFGETSGVRWSGIWFSLSASDTFEVSFVVEHLSAVMWLVVSVVASMLAYFSMLSQLRNTRSASRGETVALPLLTFGAVFVLISANFVAYYFGWVLVVFSGFLAIGFSSTARDERARAAFRYVILSILPEMIFAAGILGCHFAVGSLSFSELNERGISTVPRWAVMCLVLGTMLRNLQIPFMQCARYVAFARAGSYSVLFIGHAALTSALFAKLFPLISSVEGIEYFAILPAVTALAAATLALAEEDPATLTAYLVSYLSASVFMSGLAGDYQASQALAYTGTIAVFLFANTLTELPAAQPMARWFTMISVLMLTGLSLSGWGWARYLEYVGLVNSGEQTSVLHWFLLGVKLVADLVMGFALWAQARDRWLMRTSSNETTRWDVVVPLALVALAGLAIVSGGRPFGGMAGSLPFEQLPSIAWFEVLVSAPGGTSASTAMSLIGSDVDIIARVIVVSVFVIPMLLGTLWLFRESKNIVEFRAFCRRVLEKVSGGKGLDSRLWDWFFNPVSKALGKAASYVDSRVIDYVLADAWLKPARWVRSIFTFIEETILDRKIIDGLGEAVATVGKSLRLVQNGQVQFYFAIGLLLMGAIVIKFIVVGR